MRRRWFIDSGASIYTINDSSILTDFCGTQDFVAVGEGILETLEDKGIRKCTAFSDKVSRSITDNDMAYVPSLTTNLLSGSSLRRKGYSFGFGNEPSSPDGGMVKITKKDTSVSVAKDILNWILDFINCC